MISKIDIDRNRIYKTQIFRTVEQVKNNEVLCNINTCCAVDASLSSYFFQKNPILLTENEFFLLRV